MKLSLMLRQCGDLYGNAGIPALCLAVFLTIYACLRTAFFEGRLANGLGIIMKKADGVTTASAFFCAVSQANMPAA